ncbi:MAG: hypothetical protein HUJ25_07965 [Crocinitomicaceae bacterium]|nr:hypothetical protein [Crocinitomicaceae bacterium]
MKYLPYIGILVIGVALGYFLGKSSNRPVLDESEPNTQLITQTITDTVIKTETIKVPVENKVENEDVVLKDSAVSRKDTLIAEQPEDTLGEENISIRTEKMIDQKWIAVHVIEDFENKDSLIKKALGIEDKMPTKILVEFWESPLNFTGYKLSKSKLVMYGMSTGVDYKLYRRKSDYFLSAETFYYSLKETEEFLPYLEVSKDVVFDD